MVTDQVWAEMERALSERPPGITHTRQVLDYAEELMAGEGVDDPREREVITLAVILHDVGIPAAIRVHGSAAGPYQEAEGEAISREILTRLGYDPAGIERVCYLVGHHHTREALDGRDFQLLWEADFLVNAREMDRAQRPAAIAGNLQTATGKRLADRDLRG
ncbi:MAG: HD domain-containing protein [Armatimonadota bacterium]